MALAEPHTAAREATALITILERPSYRRRNRACPGANLDHTPVGVVAHDDPGCIAGQTLRRSGRNAHTALEHRLPGLVGVDQDGGVDVHNDLVALSRGAGIDASVERGLGEQRQCVGLLLLHRRHSGVGRLLTSPPILALPSRLQRLQEQGTHLRGQPPSDPYRTVFVLIQVQRASSVVANGLLSLGLAVHPAPATHDSLDVFGGAGAAHCQQSLFRLGRCHTGQLTNLSVRQLAAGERLRQQWKRAERARHPDVLPSRARRVPHAPG
jgi:hypothetical protein